VPNGGNEEVNLWPTGAQWLRWSLPSKLTAIGVLLSIISVGTYAIEKIFHITQYLRHPASSETELNVAERGTILIELGYNLYAFGLGIRVLGEEIDKDKVNRELKSLYDRLGLRTPEAEVGPEMFKSTRSALISDRDRHFIDIGMHLGAAYGIGCVIIYHQGTNYEVQGREEMPKIAHELRTELRALGLLTGIEQERKIENYLVPTRDDSTNAYSQRLQSLKAAIMGEIRRQYGT
jgi:hypothetical protein